MRFWDSSAVVPLLVEEPAGVELLAILSEEGGLIVWWGTPVECASAIARREREGHLDVVAASAALARLRALELAWAEVAPTPVVRRLALRLLRSHALRAADSLQLAAGLVAAEQDPAALGFVCLDDRLRTAAQREGFTVSP
ncbi:MAG: type II toxin-antitoxin system VapC family toxin [Alphaproteobacteria bacterium]